ncbi:MAG: hemerythrin domain-containing protein, partial [Dehalococcoidia bacterium]|nr:hemerythrin domain-containing protein [Dehalococcoidia bacterium]
ITDLLKQDHDTVNRLFAEFTQTPPDDGQRQQELIDQIAEELEVHAQAEEEIFYPALRSVSERVDHARAEHAQVRGLLGDAEGREPASAEFAEKVARLEQAVMAHVAEEEGPMFSEADRLGADELTRLGQRFAERKETLKTSLLQRGLRGMKLAAKKIA